MAMRGHRQPAIGLVRFAVWRVWTKAGAWSPGAPVNPCRDQLDQRDRRAPRVRLGPHDQRDRLGPHVLRGALNPRVDGPICLFHDGLRNRRRWTTFVQHSEWMSLSRRCCRLLNAEEAHDRILAPDTDLNMCLFSKARFCVEGFAFNKERPHSVEGIRLGTPVF